MRTCATDIGDTMTTSWREQSNVAVTPSDLKANHINNHCWTHLLAGFGTASCMVATVKLSFSDPDLRTVHHTGIETQLNHIGCVPQPMVFCESGQGTRQNVSVPPRVRRHPLLPSGLVVSLPQYGPVRALATTALLDVRVGAMLLLLERGRALSGARCTGTAFSRAGVEACEETCYRWPDVTQKDIRRSHTNICLASLPDL